MNLLLLFAAASLLAAQDFVLLPKAFVVDAESPVTIEFLGAPQFPGDARSLSNRGKMPIDPGRRTVEALEPGNIVLAAGFTASRVETGVTYCSAKSLLVSGSISRVFAEPAGLAAELIPKDNPYVVEPGESIRVRFVVEGQPAKNAAIYSTTSPTAQHDEAQFVGRTNSEGELEVSIGSRGVWKITGVYVREKVEEEKDRTETYITTLTFEVDENFSPRN